jgi:hypothetical protein
MDSDHLTTKQAATLYAGLFDHLNYLLRLKRRTEELRFPEDDPLYLSTRAAYDALWQLRQRVHSLSRSTHSR